MAAYSYSQLENTLQEIEILKQAKTSNIADGVRLEDYRYWVGYIAGLKAAKSIAIDVADKLKTS